MSVPAPPEDFGYGVSLYTSAWPLLKSPLANFQIGLASIWIVPDNRKINYPLLPHGTVARDNWPERGPSYRDVFQTIEGGLGFWASTQFGVATSKFRINGTANGYNQEISSPGWGFGNPSPLKPDQMGIAQLSPTLLLPPDGLTFRKDTCGDLLGYAWMALPLLRAKKETAGSHIPTGDQSWTLFLNSKDFRGPVAFYIPDTWSRVSLNYAPAVGRGLDARPGLVTGGAIEINTVPRLLGESAKGDHYSRIPGLQFPVNSKGQTVLIHNMTHYSKEALFDQVGSWLGGGPVASSEFKVSSSVTPNCSANPLVVHQGQENRLIKGCESWVSTTAIDPVTFGLQWKSSAVTPWINGMGRAQFPEYFREEGKEVLAVPVSTVPTETGLTETQFPTAGRGNSYLSDESPSSLWRSPGPKAGPFEVRLSDGSLVTYSWYRFVDQPSVRAANLSRTELERLQIVVEKIHRAWTTKKQYMPAPRIGHLVALDNALLVKPPQGLEFGYVPIVTSQRQSRL